MKQMTTPARIQMFTTNVLDTLTHRKKPSTKLLQGKKPSVDERRKLGRRDFSYYMQVYDSATMELVGSLTDIGSGGFKLDSQNPIPLNKDIQFRMDLTSEVARKAFMVFVARSKWCKTDPLDPFCYNVGFQLINISPADIEIFNRMMDKYATKHENRLIDLRHSNKW